MAYFPMFVELEGRPCLIVGGGAVALRKARRLLPYGPCLTVVAQSFVPELEALEGAALYRRAFRPRDVEGQALVVAATGDGALNREIAALCRARRIPVNAVDDKDNCTFLFPALVRRGPLSIGISTGGASPTAAVYVKEKIEAAPPGAPLFGPRCRTTPPGRGCSRRCSTHVWKREGRWSRPNSTRWRRGWKERGRGMHKKGFVYLVGAGCGSADLITVRGLRLLQSCDAVVYDDLIDPALLAQAARAEQHPAGKRCGRHSMPQSEINSLLVRLGQSGKTVVRLKGGDPFVFGRGGEEFLALQAAGVPCEEVPGISSCIAVPAAAGIPVTHRGASRSFHVITGHTAQTGDTLPESLEALAALHGTLVFLMGLNSLEQIAARLTAAGKPPETPAAVVSGGNAPHPATVRGTLADIAEKARAARVQAPAVIVVGAAAALELCALAAPVLPLAGVRVGLVGTPAFTERLARRLEALGAAAVPCMTARVRPLPPQPGWERLADGRSCWVVLTSRNGVGCFFDALAAARIDVRRLHACRFAAIGPATAEALAQRGITADLCPEQATGAELARALCAAAGPGEEILLFRAAESSPEMRGILTAQGFSVREYTLYKTEYAAASPNAEADYLAFASAGGVRAWFSACGAAPKGAVCVCIGPVTARALAQQTGAPFLTAEDISAEGVAECILRAHRHKKAQEE